MTPLQILQGVYPKNQAAIALVESALAEPERAFSISKARKLNDTILNLKKAAKDATDHTIEGRRKACLAKAPTLLKARTAAGEALPTMHVAQVDSYCCQPWDLETKKREEIRVAVLKWVVGEEVEAEAEAKNGTAAGQKQGQAAEERSKTAGETKQGATGENQARKGEVLSLDLFLELLDFMAPLWDPARKRDDTVVSVEEEQ